MKPILKSFKHFVITLLLAILLAFMYAFPMQKFLNMTIIYLLDAEPLNYFQSLLVVIFIFICYTSVKRMKMKEVEESLNRDFRDKLSDAIILGIGRFVSLSVWTLVVWLLHLIF